MGSLCFSVLLNMSRHSIVLLLPPRFGACLKMIDFNLVPVACHMIPHGLLVF